MEIATNLNEAMNFFLRNSAGKICCVKEGKENKECGCFPEAENFFEE